MATKPVTQDQMSVLLREIREIKAQLNKLLLLIPEETLEEYENSAGIRKAYSRAVRAGRPGRS